VTTPAVTGQPLTRAKASRDDILMRVGLGFFALWLVVTVALPLWSLLSKSVQNQAGDFIGLANYLRYFSTPSLFQSIWNSLFVSALTTLIVLPLAFLYAYGLTRSQMRFKPLFQALALIPILAPSLLPAISLIYLFGNQGLLKGWLFGQPVYGATGIVFAQVLYCFPHALMILVTSLSMADQRLYESAEALGASRLRVFLTVTLPGVKYGLISTGFVVFTMVMTDFGIAKVVGGRFNVLATDIYKQVVGQQNFEMGAVVGVILLVPALLSFAADRIVQRRLVAQLSSRAVPLVPKAKPGRDLALALFCAAVGGLIFLVFAVSVWASFITFWPYNLTLTLKNYAFADYDPLGWGAFYNSLKMAAGVAVLGTAIVFLGAYLVEKSKGFVAGRALVHFLAMTPLAVPGLVLGLSYIFFFNMRDNPLNVLYGTMALLVVNTVAHFYTVSHLTAVTALKQLDAEFEAVSASLKVPVWRTFFRVTVPICLPAILDIAIYFFVNAMTTVSAVIFLYSSDTKIASLAIVNMDESGFTAAAAGMATVIVLTSATVKLAQLGLSRLLRRTQAWRQR
jgi:iron(III) transport system permease protein